MSSCNDNPCIPNDPCGEHDNCGCFNPTTFNCVTYTGDDLPCLDVTSGETGDDIFAKIEAKICNVGKVLINDADTCPAYLFDKLEEGTNISFQITGTGCDRKITIHAVEGGTPVDVNAKVSALDTTSNYLNSKLVVGTYLTKTIVNPAGNETLRFDVDIETLISADAGNQLVQGTDGGLMTALTAPDGSETKLVQGTGVTITGTGTPVDPYIVSTNPSITVARACFDNIWRPITLVATGNVNVVYTAGAPQYRYRFDGTLEFKGSATYDVSFGTYIAGTNRTYTITVGNIPTTCLTGAEQAGTADLKGITYIDAMQASVDQIVQQYGYIIRKSSSNLIVVFQSSFSNATTRTIVVNFDGVISHPTI